MQNYERSHSEGEHILVGQLAAATADKTLYEVEVKNGFSIGDELLLMTPKGNYPFQLARMESLKDEAMIRAPGSGYQVKLQTPVSIEKNDIPFCFLIKEATVRKVA